MMTIKQIEKEIRQAAVHLGKERDKLRELQSELNGLEERASDAIDSLEQAADRLSEFV